MTNNAWEASVSRSRVLIAGIGAITIALALGACGGESSPASSSSSGSKPDAVTVGVIPIVDVAPIYLGKEQGFFSAEKIELKLETAQGGATIIPAVASGQYQFGFSNVTSLLLAQNKGLALKIVAAGDSTTGTVGKDFGAVVAAKGSPITKPAELAGKKVAVNTLNNIATTTLSKVVRDDGGDPKTIKFVELGFPDMPGALAKNQVDAAWVVEPFLTITKQQGGTPVAWPYAGTDAKLMIAAYFTSSKLASSNPDLVKRFSSAMSKSLAFAEQNPDQARAVLSSYTKIDPGVTSALTLPKFPAEVNPDSLTLLGSLAVQDGLLSKEPDVKALLP
jgi:NitT/TauT family transport system substrate-binding protein